MIDEDFSFSSTLFPNDSFLLLFQIQGRLMVNISIKLAITMIGLIIASGSGTADHFKHRDVGMNNG